MNKRQEGGIVAIKGFKYQFLIAFWLLVVRGAKVIYFEGEEDIVIRYKEFNYYIQVKLGVLTPQKIRQILKDFADIEIERRNNDIFVLVGHQDLCGEAKNYLSACMNIEDAKYNETIDKLRETSELKNTVGGIGSNEDFAEFLSRCYFKCIKEESAQLEILMKLRDIEGDYFSCYLKLAGYIKEHNTGEITIFDLEDAIGKNLYNLSRETDDLEEAIEKFHYSFSEISKLPEETEDQISRNKPVVQIIEELNNFLVFYRRKLLTDYDIEDDDKNSKLRELQGVKNELGILKEQEQELLKDMERNYQNMKSREYKIISLKEKFENLKLLEYKQEYGEPVEDFFGF